jgi:hypothetical protein
MVRPRVLGILVALLLFQVMHEIPFGVLPISSNVEHCSHASLGNRTAVIRRNSSTTSSAGNPQFVFLMGTEGSGHHFWSTLIERSPNYARLRQLKLLGAAENITHQLFSKRQLDQSLFAGSPCHTDWNGTLLMEQTAQKLRFVAAKLPPNLTVPLNGIPSTKPVSGMISYPNFKSTEKCAGFRHPDVHLLQLACRDAQVSCHFILQYRDPMATLRSTTRKRKIHSVGYAIALYTSMYATLTFQLSTMTPSSLEFCWHYSDSHPSARLGTLLGYTTEEEFRMVFAKHYVPSNTTDVDTAVPQHQKVLLDSLLLAYEQLKSKCHDVLQSI